GIGNWELGIGNWELGIGNWELGIILIFVQTYPVGRLSLIPMANSYIEDDSPDIEDDPPGRLYFLPQIKPNRIKPLS
ncbi:MAG: hypothetical protein HC903_20980, partial [Methylacidiphilales bacterium]|nr:hypothetical protein [Candidatus Methylacidiphilales bacterium]